MSDVTDTDAPIEQITDSNERVYEHRQFYVGERVRIHLNPECRIQVVPDSPAARMKMQQHHPSFDGLTGVVTKTLNPPRTPGHYYEVTFDRHVYVPGFLKRLITGDDFAAAELELLPSGRDDDS